MFKLLSVLYDLICTACAGVIEYRGAERSRMCERKGFDYTVRKTYTSQSLTFRSFRTNTVNTLLFEISATKPKHQRAVGNS